MIMVKSINFVHGMTTLSIKMTCCFYFNEYFNSKSGSTDLISSTVSIEGCNEGGVLESRSLLCWPLPYKTLYRLLLRTV